MEFPKTVKDQGSMPTCASCAVAAAIECIHPGFEGSSLFLHYNASKIAEKGMGVSLHQALTTAQRMGVCSEQTWPSRPELLNVRPVAKAFSEAKSFRVRTFVPLVGADPVIDWLSKQMPVVCSISNSLRTSISLDSSFDFPSRDANHAVLVLSHNKNTDSLIIRNSWGKDWGDSGNFSIPINCANDKLLCRNFFGVVV